MRYIGQSPRRREDPRLLTGRGRYVADIVRPRMLAAAVVRSTHAHARIRRIVTDQARALPGFVDCITFADIRDRAGVIPIRMGARAGLVPYLQRPLAEDRVRYVGEPVAVVVATDPLVAEDVRELVEVDYEALPAVVEPAQATAPGAPAIFPGGNLAETWTVDLGDVEAALARSHRVLRRTFSTHRHTALPLETRGLVAEYDDGHGTLTMWGPTKVPYFNRQVLAGMLGMDEDRIHLVEPDVGGGFGARG